MKREDEGESSWDVVFIVFVLAIAFALRWGVLTLTHFGIESDEAIVGLMAKHITEGRSWPIFYYGQPYMGSLEAFLTALSFKIFGQTSFAIKVVPLTFSLLLVVLIYRSARYVTDKFGARVAALLAALGPNALIVWSGKARGGFIELVAIGSLAFLLSFRILKKLSGDNSLTRARSDRHLGLGFDVFLLGFVLGVGWWTNNQIIFYLTAILPVLLVVTLRRLRFGECLRHAFIFVSSFIIGSLPFWQYNLLREPKFETFKLLGASVSWETMLLHLQGFFSEALPIILGSKRLWEGGVDVSPGASYVAYLLYFLALTSAVIAVGRTLESKPGERANLWILILFVLAAPFIFAKSERGWLTQEPRYLLPLYSALFIIAGRAASKLWMTNTIAKVVSATALLGIAFIQLSSNFDKGLVVPAEPFVASGERVQSDHGALYSWLKENRIRHIHTNYWIGYRTAFETAEEITFTLFGDFRVVRIPEYELQGGQTLADRVYVLVPSQAREMINDLIARGYRYDQTLVGGYVIISGIDLLYPLGEELPLSEGQVAVGSRSEWRKRMIDSNFGSRWGSGEPQTPQMKIEVTFDSPTHVTAIELDSGFWPQDAPRVLTVEVEDESSCLVATGLQFSSARQLAEGARGQARSSGWLIAFPPRTIRKLRLLQEGEDPVYDWSIAELKIYAPPSDGTGKLMEPAN